MFDDIRSKKVILVAHCILNENAKADGCALFPGGFTDVIQTILASGAGILQLPCPQFLCLGLSRKTIPESFRSVESEATRIAHLMKDEHCRKICLAKIPDIVMQVEQYRQHHFQVTGIIGVNATSTCGVDTAWSDDREYEGRGLFFRLLEKELARVGITLPMLGIKPNYPQEAVAAVRGMLNGK